MAIGELEEAHQAMAADRASGVVEPHAADEASATDEPETGKLPRTHQLRLNDRPPAETAYEAESSRETPSGGVEADTEANDGSESAEVGGQKPQVDGHYGPFRSLEEQSAARRQSRENAEEYNNEVSTEELEPSDSGSVQSVLPSPIDQVDDHDSPDAEAEGQDFGSPLPGEEDTPVTRAESRVRVATANGELRSDEEGAAPISETGAVESTDQTLPWPAHAEQMKTKWVEHESRWPVESSPEGSPPDGEPPDEGNRGAGSPAERSGDEPGSWRGDGDQYLNHEENYSASRVFDRVSDSEPKVTDVLRENEEEVEGAQLVGLEYRLKGEDRFKEKVAEHLAAKLREDPRETAEKIPDALRYTYQLPVDDYTRGYNEITKGLKESGNEIVLSRNFWSDAEYKGINSRWRTPKGQLFEVQFHTPESFEAKQLTHGAYERLRNPLTDAEEIEELEAFQRDVSMGIPIPDGAIDIPNYRR